MNEIYVRRRSKILLPKSEGSCPLEVVASFLREAERLGFLLDRPVVEALRLRSVDQVERLHRQLMKVFRERVGGNRELAPLYPNFPHQVMEMHEAELYFNALLHYLTLKRPQFDVLGREPLDEGGQRRLIRLGDSVDFEAMFEDLLRSAAPFSPEDKADIHWLIAQYRDGVARLLPETMRFKENIAVVGAALVHQTTIAETVLDRYIQTATDVLRLAAGMSDGDVSLAAPCKFGKFRRRERDLLLRWVERAASRTEDMLRWKGRWIRLGERLHPGEYAKRYPKTAEAFDVLRNEKPFETFNSRVAKLITKKDFQTAIDALECRPGELTRRLDHLARSGANSDLLLDIFGRVSAKVATPVLLQAMTHFRHRNEAMSYRTFFPKGAVAKAFTTPAPLPPLDSDVAIALASACELALLDRFASLPPLGRSYIEPALKNYMAPFSQRSASKSLRTLTRGSRLPLPEGRVLRFFVWWKNGRSRADIDLSAVFYGRDFRYLDTVAYYNLRDYGGCHSGDIVDAPQGAAEFIDVDMDRCRERGVRYVLMCLNSFTSQPYCDLPECFAGWMGRKEAGSGEIFEPKTIVDKIDVASDTRVCLPAAFDLEERTVLWMDAAYQNTPAFSNNVHNNLSGVSLMLRAMAELKKTDLYTLFDLHARARGRRVDDPRLAETVFSVNEGITPFDLTRITSEFL